MEQSLKIHIVDDSPLMRERLKEMFHEHKFIQIAGESGSLSEARHAMNVSVPDVIVLDIRMPDGSGIDLIKDVKTQCPDTSVIMFTNYPFPQHRQKCLEAGAEYFFDKSTGFDDLFTAIQNIAARKFRID